jgi:hypothetical protein
MRSKLLIASIAIVPLAFLFACNGKKEPALVSAAAAFESHLIHTPPIARLSEEQLRGLAERCRRYDPSGAARGPYSAKYCDDALAAWSDSPLHMLVIPPPSAAPQ